MIKIIGRYIGVVLVLVLSANLAFAQEGFGTQQPDKSAAIHIESGKRGLLIPRVELTRTNLAAPVITPVAQSLLVYNEGDTTGEYSVSPGYYYWDTDRWVRFAMQDDVQEITLDGDVTGPTGDTKVVALQGIAINGTAPEANQMLVYNGTEWTPTSGKNLTAWVGDPNDPNTPSSEGATIEVMEGGENAVLVETSLKVKNESITTDHLAPAGNNQIMVTDNTGVPTWKDADKVTPRFFYMPAVIFDTRQTGTGLTRDLYQDYVNQFSGVKPYHVAHGANGSSVEYTGGIISSDPTNRPTIAVFQKEELVYYITYYDTDVFENLSIDSNGVLTYDIIGNATPSSYMNIVFVIK